MYEFKILKYTTKMMMGYLDEGKLEQELNDLAQQGWRVLSISNVEKLIFCGGFGTGD